MMLGSRNVDAGSRRCRSGAEKGDLKLTLDGYKLKGSWVLVRTKGGWPAAVAAIARGC